MNETAITRFLAAEAMGWEERWERDTETLKLIRFWVRIIDINSFELQISVRDFDPIHNIAHAFMVEDAIAKMYIEVIRMYCYRLSLEFGVPQGKFSTDFLFAHASPKHRSIAAVRALATDEQIQKMELLIETGEKDAN